MTHHTMPPAPCARCGRPRYSGDTPIPGMAPTGSIDLCGTCQTRKARGQYPTAHPRNYNPAWMGDALCAQVDTDMFFPEQGASPANAKKVCAACPVAAQCLAYALAEGVPHGVWGGLTATERARIGRRTRTNLIRKAAS